MWMLGGIFSSFFFFKILSHNLIRKMSENAMPLYTSDIVYIVYFGCTFKMYLFRKNWQRLKKGRWALARVSNVYRVFEFQISNKFLLYAFRFFQANFIVQNNLGGAFVWSVEMDDFNNKCGQGRYPLITKIDQILQPWAWQPTQRPTILPVTTPANPYTTPTTPRWPPVTTPAHKCKFQTLNNFAVIENLANASFHILVHFNLPSVFKKQKTTGAFKKKKKKKKKRRSNCDPTSSSVSCCTYFGVFFLCAVNPLLIRFRPKFAADYFFFNKKHSVGRKLFWQAKQCKPHNQIGLSQYRI